MPPQKDAFFQTHDGTRLFRRGWGEANKGVVLLMHGFGDHIGRYGYLIQALNRRGYRVEGFDYRGHGQSGGPRGHIESFDQYVQDLNTLHHTLEQATPHRPFFLLGHHLGGLIALRYGIQYPQRPQLAGVIASSPLLGMLQTRSIAHRVALRSLTHLWPSLTQKVSVKPQELSHDLDVIEETSRDPLLTRIATIRWTTETKKAIRQTHKQAQRFHYPFLLQQAGHDLLVDKQAGAQFFEKLKSTDKRRIEYPGYLHEIYNETPDRRGPVFEDLGDWLDEHLPSQGT